MGLQQSQQLLYTMSVTAGTGGSVNTSGGEYEQGIM